MDNYFKQALWAGAVEAFRTFAIEVDFNGSAISAIVDSSTQTMPILDGGVQEVLTFDVEVRAVDWEKCKRARLSANRLKIGEATYGVMSAHSIPLRPTVKLTVSTLSA